ncbi:MAG TPA: hypothetical protein VEO54_15185 [Thermoanaerobaculia bacterium]|nr:hypothetical protein [Thermoanaerobaculia bacterium]
MRSKKRAATLLLFSLALFAACGGEGEHTNMLGSLSNAIGLGDAPPLPAEVIDIVIDASDGSPACVATVRGTLDIVLPYVAARPGSELRLWALGVELADTRMLAAVTSSAPKRRGERARTLEADRFVATSRALLLQAVAPIFDHPAKTQSPIAEGISRVAYSRVPTGRRRLLIVITDAREVSGIGPRRIDFECQRVLPDAQTWVARLHEDAILSPGTLAHTDVHFAFVALAAIPKRGCPVTLARARRVEELWRAALMAAGATSIAFTTDAPQIDVPTEGGGGA